MKLKILTSLMVAVLAVMVAYTTGSRNLTCQVSYRLDTEIRVGRGTIKAEVVKNAIKRQKGLGGRECIGRNQGMLFVFDKPGEQAFWMKDMKFPIDIIWLSSERKIVHIEHDLSPSTYPTTYASIKPAQYVLEIQAGRAKSLNLSDDSTLNFSL